MSTPRTVERVVDKLIDSPKEQALAALEEQVKRRKAAVEELENLHRQKVEVNNKIRTLEEKVSDMARSVSAAQLALERELAK